MSLPRFFGTGEFVVSKRFFEVQNFISRGFLSNILQLIDDITEPKAQRLSEEAVGSIAEWFPVGLEAIYVLEDASKQHELIGIARSDLNTAVDKLMDRGNRFGDSKWASLQAAEKCLKAAIDLHGGKFDRTHKLEELRTDLAALGVHLSSPNLLETIQCTPGIRYGKEPCSREEALAAHHALLHLILDLVRAGARFHYNLIIRRLSSHIFQTIRV
jgi:HEPN domain-containing protein